MTTTIATEPRDPGAEYAVLALEFSDGKYVGSFSVSSPPCNGAVGGQRS